MPQVAPQERVRGQFRLRAARAAHLLVHDGVLAEVRPDGDGEQRLLAWVLVLVRLLVRLGSLLRRRPNHLHPPLLHDEEVAAELVDFVDVLARQHVQMVQARAHERVEAPVGGGVRVRVRVRGRVSLTLIPSA